MLAEIEAEKAKHKRAIYGDDRAPLTEDDEKESKAKTLALIDDLFDKAQKKFPKSEFTYIWIINYSTHYHKAFIQPLVRC